MAEKDSDKNHEQIYFKTPFNNTCTDVMNTRGWQRVTENEPHHLHWCDVSWLRDNFDNSYLPENLKICHFRNHYELTRKNLMVKNLKRLKKMIRKSGGNDTLDFFPITYELPMEYHIFVEEFKKVRNEYENKLVLQKQKEASKDTGADSGLAEGEEVNIPTWIMKPVGRAQGRGIFLFRRLKDIQDWKRNADTTTRNQNNQSSNYMNLVNSNISNPSGAIPTTQTNQADLDSHNNLSDPSLGSHLPGHQQVQNLLAQKVAESQTPFQVENYVVSRYIDNPYLIMGKKFDIRMYVLVTSFSPLTVWMHREGFARFSNQRFSLENIDNAIVHWPRFWTNFGAD